mmetsp:Transcript_31214/g.72595  ORF Transcript_31214/g.72595 Transcript_31214/m.72595 type:complete len:227 (-) Transcript_31214:435-1115(-)
MRTRYWARSFVGWEFFSRAQPNAAHRALVALEARGHICAGLITQNVDGLHQAAGSKSCIDLHGRIDAVECLGCGHRSSRASMQERLRKDNAAWLQSTGLLGALPVELRADGDSQLNDEQIRGLRVPACEVCGGILKPAVTFFGGSVPNEVVQRARAAVLAADCLLVIGSSLQVFSAFRFARQAAQEKVPIAIINIGETRADDLATMRIECDAVDVMEGVLSRIIRS